MAKACANCGEQKPHEDYYRDAKSKDGLTSSCKPCKRGFQKSYRSRSEHVAKAYKSRNRERISDYHRAHRVENLGMHWAISARKRLKDHGFHPVIIEFTEAEVLARYGEQCVYCGGDFEELDHFIPLCAGGHHKLSNVRPSCTSCNRKKLREDLVIAGLARACRGSAGTGNHSVNN